MSKKIIETNNSFILKNKPYKKIVAKDKNK